ASAQEINASLSVNTSKIDESSRQVLQILESDLRTFINDRSWTNIQFASQEKIDCSFTIIVNEAITATSFVAELHVQSRRPVFNSIYMSPMLNYRDDKIIFDYIEHQPLDFDINNISNNLTAVIAYYIYLILGLDFDSMTSLGGSSFFQLMQTIATNAQVTSQSEWGSLADYRSRMSIVASLNNPLYDDYRTMWYHYHRKGLDEMTLNIDAARKNIVTSLSVLSDLKNNQPYSILLDIFGDAKLDEIIDVYSNGKANERRDAIETLLQLYPTKSSQIDRLSNK
ncbi:MAG: DUF4835 family protein, partial [Proteiniphilum sp.]|nr:DUF4835 family protein [Proteiniphilum sp.]